MQTTTLKRDGKLLHETVSSFANMGLRVTPRQIRHWDEQKIIKLQKDESGYRRLSTQDIEKIILILVFKMLGFGLSEIRKEIFCLAPKEELFEILKKNPDTFLSKQKDSSGREKWYPKPEIRESWKRIGSTFDKTRRNLQSAHQLFVRSQSNLANAMMMYRTEEKRK